MVFGELNQAAVAVEIGPAIPHLSDQVMNAVQQHRCRSSSHPALIDFTHGSLEDRVVGIDDRSPYGQGHLIVGTPRNPFELLADDLHRHLAGNFPSGVATHPVGYDE